MTRQEKGGLILLLAGMWVALYFGLRGENIIHILLTAIGGVTSIYGAMKFLFSD